MKRRERIAASLGAMEKIATEWMDRIDEPEALVCFIDFVCEDRRRAFITLEAAGLVVRHLQPNGSVRLQWPKPTHPAVAAFLATVPATSAVH
jgi:hypothetical protein